MGIVLSNMSLAAQVLERQAGHAQAVREHLSTCARLSNGDLGLILQLLHFQQAATHISAVLDERRRQEGGL